MMIYGWLGNSFQYKPIIVDFIDLLAALLDGHQFLYWVLDALVSFVYL